MTQLTIPQIKNFSFQDKLVCMTAYSARMATLIDPYADIILVGDSLGMTLHGLPSTVGVTLEIMISAGKAVMRGRNKALVVVDMPYGTYEADPLIAYQNATKILQETGADAVKLEGGAIMQPIINFLTERNIPVMGHVGLLPQSISSMGSYAARGKTEAEAEKLIQDISIISNSGCFAIVIEGVVEEIARKMVQASTVPTIGIGASVSCHGQVLVSDDLLGITEKTAKFVKKYFDASTCFSQALEAFSKDVRQGHFPTEKQIYNKN